MITLLRIIGLCSLFCCFQFWASAQLCSDNTLRSNSFRQGEFGAGPTNILTSDPYQSSTYTYNPLPGPNEGGYVLTNNTGPWNNPNFLATQDNSGDPNGYMMVVNGADHAGVFYRQTIDDLCEHTHYVIGFDVISMLGPNSNLTQANIGIEVNGFLRTTTGDLPNDGNWHHFEISLTTGTAETAFSLALRTMNSGNGGSDFAIDNITVRACMPNVNITPQQVQPFCEGEALPVTFQADYGGRATYSHTSVAYQWQHSTNGQPWQNIPTPFGFRDQYTHTDTAVGLYYYRILVATGYDNLSRPACRISVSAPPIEVVPIHYVRYDSICEGQSVELGGIYLQQTGTYMDTLTSSIGCDSVVTLHLTIVPRTQLFAAGYGLDPTCHDQANGQIILSSIVGGTPPLVAYVNGSRQDTLQRLTGLAAGLQQVRIEDRYRCYYEFDVVLNAPPPYAIDLGTKQTVSLGDVANIQTTGNQLAVSYDWTPEEWFTCTQACATTTFLPRSSAWVHLQATSDRGCTAEDSVYIQVEEERRLFFPNAFSPNNDGQNDVWVVYGLAPNVQRIVSLSLYDRWGSCIAAQEDVPANYPAYGWDGQVQGQPAPQGVYVYRVEVLFLDGKTKVYTGDVTLFR